MLSNTGGLNGPVSTGKKNGFNSFKRLSRFPRIPVCKKLLVQSRSCKNLVVTSTMTDIHCFAGTTPQASFDARNLSLRNFLYTAKQWVSAGCNMWVHRVGMYRSQIFASAQAFTNSEVRCTLQQSSARIGWNFDRYFWRASTRRAKIWRSTFPVTQADLRRRKITSAGTTSMPCNIFAEMDLWLEITYCGRTFCTSLSWVNKQTCVIIERWLERLTLCRGTFPQGHLFLETTIPRTEGYAMATAVSSKLIHRGSRSCSCAREAKKSLQAQKSCTCTAPKKGTKNGPGYQATQIEPVFGFTRRAQKQTREKGQKMMLGPSHFLLHLLLALAISARQLRETDMKELTPLACPPAGWRSCQRRSTFTQSDHLQTIAFNKTCLWGRHASNKVFLLHPGKASSGGHQFHSISAHPLLLHRLRVDESRENSFRQRRKPSV